MKKIFVLFLKSLIYLFIALLLSQCFQCGSLNNIREHTIGPSKVYKTILVSKNFNSIELQLIKDAAQEWEISTNHVINLEVKDFDFNYISLIQDRMSYIIFLECPPDSEQLSLVDEDVKKYDNKSYTLAFYDRHNIIPTIFMVSDRIDDRKLYRQVAGHEIGHAIGLDHNTDTTNSIMYRSMDKASEHITTNDLYNLCKIYYCSPNFKKE